MSSRAGWYPDPGGQPNTYRYWDGKAWSAATTQNPNAAPPNQGLVTSGPAAAASQSGQAYGQREYGPQPYGTQGSGPQSAYAGYQATTQKKSGRGWWVAGAALVVVLVVIIVVAVRQLGGAGGIAGGDPGGQGSQDPCPTTTMQSAPPTTDPQDGRVHGGPLSYPELGAPWTQPSGENRVPFGTDVLTQEITVQQYAPGKIWVASVLVGRLAAGDGFFTPKQGSQIVVKCILGQFYGNAEVKSDVVQNKATTVDGHDAWIVESKLSFDIQGLDTKGERLIVVIVATGETSAGLYYASIPDTVPQYLPVAKELISQLKVDG